MGRYQYLFYKLYLFLKDKKIFKEWIFISESYPLEIKLSLLQLYASFQPVKQPFSPLLYCFRLSFTSLKS